MIKSFRSSKNLVDSEVSVEHECLVEDPNNELVILEKAISSHYCKSCQHPQHFPKTVEPAASMSIVYAISVKVIN